MSTFSVDMMSFKLSHLTSVRQLCDESVNDYIRRFHDIKNRCFSVNITEKDLAGLAFNGLRSHIKERLEGYDFFYYYSSALESFGYRKPKQRVSRVS